MNPKGARALHRETGCVLVLAPPNLAFPDSTGVESQAHGPKGVAALWLGRRGLH